VGRESRDTALRGLIRKYPAVLIIAAVGLLLLLWPQGGTDEAVPQTAQEQPYDAAILEEQLAQALSQISGVGRVIVAVRVDTDYTYEYATDDSQSGQSHVTVEDADGGEHPVIIRRLVPCCSGVLVVCDGGGSAGVRLAVTQAVSALTGLASDRIAVLKMAQ